MKTAFCIINKPVICKINNLLFLQLIGFCFHFFIILKYHLSLLLWDFVVFFYLSHSRQPGLQRLMKYKDCSSPPSQRVAFFTFHTVFLQKYKSSHLITIATQYIDLETYRWRFTSIYCMFLFTKMLQVLFVRVFIVRTATGGHSCRSSFLKSFIQSFWSRSAICCTCILKHRFQNV